jgi:hypothetical protein
MNLRFSGGREALSIAVAVATEIARNRFAGARNTREMCGILSQRWRTIALIGANWLIFTQCKML